MKNVSNFNPPPLTTHADKQAHVRNVMDLPKVTSHGKPKGKFRRITINHATNGVSVEHEMEQKPSKNGDTVPYHSKPPHVFNDDHPIMKHINALHGYLSEMGDKDPDNDGD